AQFDLPSDTTGLTFDGEYWWMIKQPEETIYCFDYGGDYVTDFPAPAPNPMGLAWDGEYLWISCLIDVRDIDVTVHQMSLDGSIGPYGSFQGYGAYGLTVLEEDIVTMDYVGGTYIDSKEGDFKRFVQLNFASGNKSYCLTFDGGAFWACVYPPASDWYLLADFDPNTGDWLGHDINVYNIRKDGLTSGIWSYTSTKVKSFGKIKAFFE
ncbi:MAG: hypothetical protein JSW52_06205, partial [Candidatus Coatesbacteria bacterium]